MNILDAIVRNTFLKQLYPDGLMKFNIGQLDLQQNRIKINLHVFDRPFIDIPKWGIWGREYNVVVIELIDSAPQKVNIWNWQNSNTNQCLYEIHRKDENIIHLLFKGDDWSIELETSFGLIFQRCGTYLL